MKNIAGLMKQASEMQKKMEELQDLILAAHADAKRKSEEASQAEMQKLTGGLSLPPGFKLPF